MTRILVHGAGRMARRVLAQLPGSKNFELLGLVSRTKPVDDIGTDWFGSFNEVDDSADLLIDFTLPGGTRLAAEWCSARNVALLSGTTGLTEDDVRALESAALKVPVLWAPNLSHGVALMTSLVRQAANALGVSAKIRYQTYTISIKRMHRRARHWHWLPPQRQVVLSICRRY